MKTIKGSDILLTIFILLLTISAIFSIYVFYTYKTPANLTELQRIPFSIGIIVLGCVAVFIIICIYNMLEIFSKKEFKIRLK